MLDDYRYLENVIQFIDRFVLHDIMSSFMFGNIVFYQIAF